MKNLCDLSFNAELHFPSWLTISTKTKVKYGIVCGSRRFNAAIEAGLDEVPCIIQEMTDVDAMGRSLEENVHRKDIPLWQNIEWVGEMYDVLRNDSLRRNTERKFVSINARYDELVRRTGLNKNKVRDYVRIALYLPKEILALLRPRENRTLYQKERLKGLLYRTLSPSGTLTLFKAKLILEKLQNLPVEKQVQVAEYILKKTRDISEQIVNLVLKYPNKHLYELEQIIRKEPDVHYRSIGLDKVTLEALVKACVYKQKKIPSLILDILKEWLKTNRYLH
jgi:ParB-like chromosome segregation protein Spo0J